MSNKVKVSVTGDDCILEIYCTDLQLACYIVDQKMCLKGILSTRNHKIIIISKAEEKKFLSVLNVCMAAMVSGMY